MCCLSGPTRYQVPVSVQRHELNISWSFVDPVTAERQRQTCRQDGHTSLRLHPTGGCFVISTGSAAACVSIHPRNDKLTGSVKASANAF